MYFVYVWTETERLEELGWTADFCFVSASGDGMFAFRISVLGDKRIKKLFGCGVWATICVCFSVAV